MIGEQFARRVARLLPDAARRPVRALADRAGLPARHAATPKTVATVRAELFGNLSPLAVRAEPRGHPTVTVVTDTLAPGYLFGGVGTAALLAASLARARGLGLRFVTRSHPADDAPVRRLFALHGVAFNGPIDLVFSPTETAAAVPLAPDDLVLTTSWWTTRAALASVPAERILYLVQEDERLFYPGGDQHLLCDELLQDDSVRSIVNTALLLEHFRATGTRGPATRGIAFEPAFPESIYRPEPAVGPRRLLFYARPTHPRNLFARGLEAIERALAAGLFPPDAWEIHFAGVGIPRVDLGGRAIHYHDTLPWADYAALVRRCDLGLSLMYTPHPSYPPLDMAASGLVVVTNRYGVKRDLSDMCANIITAPPSVNGLVDGLRRGAALTVDAAARARNHAGARLSRRWADSFAPVLDRL